VKFRCKWSRAIYIVRPSQRTVNQLGIVVIQPGLRAIFDRDSHEFDSKIAQENAGWTDEEREAVEGHLLKHKDYGNGLILMPGQDVPEHLAKLARVDLGKQMPLCEFVEFIDGKVNQCSEDALPGEKRCKQHSDKKGQIIKGMLTAT
jgi:hypothetical protein